MSNNPQWLTIAPDTRCADCDAELLTGERPFHLAPLLMEPLCQSCYQRREQMDEWGATIAERLDKHVTRYHPSPKYRDKFSWREGGVPAETTLAGRYIRRYGGTIWRQPGWEPEHVESRRYQFLDGSAYIMGIYNQRSRGPFALVYGVGVHVDNLEDAADALALHCKPSDQTAGCMIGCHEGVPLSVLYAAQVPYSGYRWRYCYASFAQWPVWGRPSTRHDAARWRQRCANCGHVSRLWSEYRPPHIVIRCILCQHLTLHEVHLSPDKQSPAHVACTQRHAALQVLAEIAQAAAREARQSTPVMGTD